MPTYSPSPVVSTLSSLLVVTTTFSSCVKEASAVETPWKQSWKLSDAFTQFVSNREALLPGAQYKDFGVSLIGWDHAAGVWVNDRPMDTGATTAEQCRRIKAMYPNQHCVFYLNSVIGLNSYKSVREKLDDPKYEGFFLKWKDGATWSPDTCGGTGNRNIECKVVKSTDVHTPMCDYNNRTKCSKFYHDVWQTPRVPTANWRDNITNAEYNLNCLTGDSCDCGKNPCGEYLFDFRNSSMRDWFLNEYIMEVIDENNEGADGVIFDDHWSHQRPSEIASESISDMGLSSNDTAEIEQWYHVTKSLVNTHLAKKNAWLFPTYISGSFVAETSAARSPTEKCLSAMRDRCQPGKDNTLFSIVRISYSNTTFPYGDYGSLELTPLDADLDVAYFMTARGKYSWIGVGKGVFGWSMGVHLRPTLSSLRGVMYPYLKDYGEPLSSSCHESGEGTGVFVRNWTKAVTTVDCNSPKPKGSIKML